MGGVKQIEGEFNKVGVKGLSPVFKMPLKDLDLCSLGRKEITTCVPLIQKPLLYYIIHTSHRNFLTVSKVEGCTHPVIALRLIKHTP